MQGLPIGIQSLRHIRESDYVYIDKTEWAYKMLKSPAYYFLSRPRRFGKSLYLDTLKQIFLGNKHFFEDTFIYDKIDWQPRPVVHLSFDKMATSEGKFESSFLYQLDTIAADYDITIPATNIKDTTNALIRALYKKYQKSIVILIDEYDEPLLRHLRSPTAEINRDLMADFYKTLKANNDCIQLVFITGVSKFPQLSLFSGANNIRDISFDPAYSSVCGYTQNDLDTRFKPYLDIVHQNFPEYTAEEFMTEVKYRYNGYNWKGEKVYNPFSMLLFLEAKEFENFWIPTGNASFLIDILKNDFVYDVPTKNIALSVLNNGFDLNYIDPTALMFQTGYLTLTAYNRHLQACDLDYPNTEVREAFNFFLLKAFAHQPMMPRNCALYMYEGLRNNDIAMFQEQCNTMFAKIPEPIFLEKYEAYYHSLIFLSFVLMGIAARSEEHTNKGRMDMMVPTPNRIFIIEYKIGDSADAALQQINDRKYYEKYLDQHKPITLIGIALGIKQRGIVDFKLIDVATPK
jgi:Predicted AAA-ATPase/PD-(D/E)XK nuclease superfamily